MAKRAKKQPSKQQRKDELVAARAELALLLDGNKHTAKAMTWNLTKTRIATRHMQEFGALPFNFTAEYEKNGWGFSNWTAIAEL